MYEWRRMTNRERHDALKSRRASRNPHHAPPRFGTAPGCYLATAACFEHRPHIVFSDERMENFSRSLLQTAREAGMEIHAWVVLPNHYHLLAGCSDPLQIRRVLGRLHGRTSRAWNLEEGSTGRQVWRQSMERPLQSDAHFFATLNYIHHNPVKHGLCRRWLDWKWSSAAEYLGSIGSGEAKRRWKEFPIGDYGKKWDP
jgi:putative transposase